MQYLFRLCVVVAFAAAATACNATPLPTPPSFSPDGVTFADGPDMEGPVIIEGGPGSAEPPGFDLRVTWQPPPTAIGVVTRVETPIAEDGSFGPIELPGSGSYYVEVLMEDEDVFVFAFTRGPDDVAVSKDPGPDTDEDGSPDVIDCAILDPTMAGQRCVP